MMRRTTSAAFLLTALAMPGCGSSNTIQVSGKLLDGSAPYKVPEGQVLGVTLIALEVADGSGSGKTVASNEPYHADLNPDDGTFTVPGPEGRGIPPGKYRVSIIRKPDATKRKSPTKPGEKAINRELDYFQDKFGPARSPIIQELKASGEFSIDLAKADATTPAPKATKLSDRSSRD
jgi:hypothetical protein